MARYTYYVTKEGVPVVVRKNKRKDEYKYIINEVGDTYGLPAIPKDWKRISKKKFESLRKNFESLSDVEGDLMAGGERAEKWL